MATLLVKDYEELGRTRAEVIEGVDVVIVQEGVTDEQGYKLAKIVKNRNVEEKRD
jgi:hypothetical protein